MDCTTFQNREIDALYGEARELDAAAADEMAEHAATCHACSARFERLKGTRGLVLSHAVEAVPADFESRIMAAVDRGMMQRALPMNPGAMHPAGPVAAPRMSEAPQMRPSKPEEGGAKIFKFMSRPAFAVAATFVLVIGAATLLMTQSSRKSPMAASESAPGAAAPTAAPMAVPPTALDEPAASGAVALGDPVPMATLAPRSAAAGATPPAEMAMNEPPPPPAFAAAPSPAKAVAASKPGAGGSGGEDRAFTAAKALYNAGRYSDALPKFEAIKTQNPEAELYAARCIQRTRGCVAAAPRYDTAAQSNAGTEAGNRATLEGAKCYQANGQVAEARKRYSVAKDEDGVAAEATQALESLDKRAPGVGSPATHAAPKAPAAPNNNSAK